MCQVIWLMGIATSHSPNRDECYPIHPKWDKIWDEFWNSSKKRMNFMERQSMKGHLCIMGHSGLSLVFSPCDVGACGIILMKYL